MSSKKLSFSFAVMLAVSGSCVWGLGGASHEYRRRYPQLAPPQLPGGGGASSHLKRFHKTDYSANESIRIQLLLVQDAKMKLDECIICRRYITLFIHHPNGMSHTVDGDSNLLIKPPLCQAAAAAAADVLRAKTTLWLFFHHSSLWPFPAPEAATPAAASGAERRAPLPSSPRLAFH